jgi:membrane protease YdiL (CAAX protease family)
MIQFLTQMSAIGLIATFFLAWFVIWLPIAIPLMIRLKWHPFEPFTPAQKLPLLVSLYPIAPLLLWGLATLKQQSFAAYGLSTQPQFWGSGLLGISIAVLGLALIFGLQQGWGYVQWQPDRLGAWVQALPLSGLIGLWVGATEELVFRGFLINQLVTLLPLWSAAIAASLIFALLHLIWDRQETVPQLPGLWLMGLVLVLARWADDGLLGLAIGLHAGWVGGLISLDTAAIFPVSDRAPVWVIGIGRQPLAGVSGIGLLLLTAVLIWAIAPGLA